MMELGPLEPPKPPDDPPVSYWQHQLDALQRQFSHGLDHMDKWADRQLQDTQQLRPRPMDISRHEPAGYTYGFGASWKLYAVFWLAVDLVLTAYALWWFLHGR